jgi:ABC-type nitrate/sulfonate/bicarbonate transport system ATPase subunit
MRAGTVVGNVELPLSWRKVEPEARHARLRAALDRLGVGHLARRRTDSLSGGEAQRVALARALVTDPKLLLLDEPAAAPDADARAAFLTDVEQVIADRQLTLVHVTHRAEEALQHEDT